ncbi:hypothetical protein OUZ56_007537 [Daphnia magna]|uniref:Uncharacterized protein n=1 Tax=Daphnia magna TaxID=35525 RepID=A0ABR0AA87_9CRUS|nr:hypothetical protein OUZ56_007537 [Daphnia magna]
MGRMKSLQPTEAGIHNLFSVRYRRLVDENNHNNINNNNNHHHHNNNNNAQLVMQNLIRMKLSQDYIAYCCGQCGHHQRLDIKRATSKNECVSSGVMRTYTLRTVYVNTKPTYGRYTLRKRSG